MPRCEPFEFEDPRIDGGFIGVFNHFQKRIFFASGDVCCIFFDYLDIS